MNFYDVYSYYSNVKRTAKAHKYQNPPRHPSTAPAQGLLTLPTWWNISHTLFASFYHPPPPPLYHSNSPFHLYHSNPARYIPQRGVNKLFKRQNLNRAVETCNIIFATTGRKKAHLQSYTSAYACPMSWRQWGFAIKSGIISSLFNNLASSYSSDCYAWVWSLTMPAMLLGRSIATSMIAKLLVPFKLFSLSQASCAASFDKQ